MSQVITITGQAVSAGSAQTLELATLLLPPIKSILKADQIINPHTHVENAASTYTQSATTAAGQPTRAALTVVTVTPTATNKIQRVGKTTLSMWLTTALTANDSLILTVETRGEQVRP